MLGILSKELPLETVDMSHDIYKVSNKIACINTAEKRFL